MQKITVVYDSKTKKLLPFEYDKFGGIIVLTSGNILGEPKVVSVDCERVDLFNGYLLDEGDVYSEEEKY